MNNSSSTRRLRHREADLAGLVEAAERVFSDRGFHATSIRDIAREAGFSIGGVYQFFASKDDLYLRVVEEQWEHFFQLLSIALAAEGFEARIHALTEAMFQAFEERRGFFKLFLSERGRLSASFSGEIATRVGQHTRRLRRELVELMRQGIDEGALRPGDPELLASAYLGMVHTCIFEAMASGATRPGRPAAEVLALFLGGAAGAAPSHPGTSRAGGAQ
jgi:AcrR family transcriptional regulator